MASKFGIDEVLLNRITKEHGTVGRVYESNGIIMYEVRVRVDPQGYRMGSNISDWAEDILELAHCEVSIPLRK
jgi:hypothetical protein